MPFHAICLRTAAAMGAGALALATTSVHAQVPPEKQRYYFSIHGGQNDLEDLRGKVRFGAGVDTPAQLRLDRNLHLGVAVGRRTENAKFEIEYERGHADVRSVTLGMFSQPGSARAIYNAVTANAYRTFSVTNRLTAFAGGGLGWGMLEVGQLAPIAGCNCFGEADGSGLVYQLRLGAEYELKDGHHLLGQYTWLRLPTASADGAPSVQYRRKWVGAWSIGYRGDF